MKLNYPYPHGWLVSLVVIFITWCSLYSAQEHLTSEGSQQKSLIQNQTPTLFIAINWWITPEKHQTPPKKPMAVKWMQIQCQFHEKSQKQRHEHSHQSWFVALLSVLSAPCASGITTAANCQKRDSYGTKRRSFLRGYCMTNKKYDFIAPGKLPMQIYACTCWRTLSLYLFGKFKIKSLISPWSALKFQKLDTANLKWETNAKRNNGRFSYMVS